MKLAFGYLLLLCLLVLGCGGVETIPTNSEATYAVQSFMNNSKKKPTLAVSILYGVFSSFQSNLSCDAQEPPAEVKLPSERNYAEANLVSIDRIDCKHWNIELTETAKSNEIAKPLDQPNGTGHVQVQIATYSSFESGEPMLNKGSVEVPIQLRFALTDSGKAIARYLGSLPTPIRGCSLDPSSTDIVCNTKCWLAKSSHGWQVIRQEQVATAKE